jgi:hypothetical protein
MARIEENPIYPGGLLHPVCDVTVSVIRGFSSDTQIRVVHRYVPGKTDCSASDGRPEIYPVAFMSEHIESTGVLTIAQI